jgi:hypothetical protein
MQVAHDQRLRHVRLVKQLVEQCMCLRHVVRVQVLNGSGEPGVGTRVAAWLREGGFQVTDVRNADRNDYFATFVVARRSDLSLAREVAHYLGGPPLVRQEWSSELADVSVLVGSDRSRLQMDH